MRHTLNPEEEKRHKKIIRGAGRFSDSFTLKLAETLANSLDKRYKQDPYGNGVPYQAFRAFVAGCAMGPGNLGGRMNRVLPRRIAYLLTPHEQLADLAIRNIKKDELLKAVRETGWKRDDVIKAVYEACVENKVEVPTFAAGYKPETIEIKPKYDDSDYDGVVEGVVPTRIRLVQQETPFDQYVASKEIKEEAVAPKPRVARESSEYVLINPWTDRPLHHDIMRARTKQDWRWLLKVMEAEWESQRFTWTEEEFEQAKYEVKVARNFLKKNLDGSGPIIERLKD